MDWFNTVAGNAILIVFGVSSVFVALEAVGFLPESWARSLNRRRASQMLELLASLGVDVGGIRRANRAAQIPTFASGDDYRKAVGAFLEKVTIRQPVAVGHVEHAGYSAFVDLMGAATDPRIAVQFARYLTTHLRQLIERGELREISDAAFIACPKAGCPTLAYEVAKLLGRPLLLHAADPKFRAASHAFQATFDCAGDPPPKGTRALIVDDSTTGGRKMTALVQALRDAGYVVSDCLVVFEPQGKGARDRLAKLDVSLHAIVSGPTREQ